LPGRVTKPPSEGSPAGCVKEEREVAIQRNGMLLGLPFRRPGRHDRASRHRAVMRRRTL
jgi:hypothetical protein